MDEVIKVSSFTRAINSFRNCGRKTHATFRGGEMNVKKLKKILPCTLNNGQCDAYYALKAKVDLLKMNVIVWGSTTVTILIPLCKENS